VTATATTTIQGVSVLSRQKKRSADLFDLCLSTAGIEVRRPDRPVQQMSWDRVSEWEIEEQKDYVVLTLRGRGATTPLVVPGWSLDDLEVLMREVTAGATSYDPNGPAPIVTSAEGNGTMETKAPPAPKASATKAPPARRVAPKKMPPAERTAAAAPVAAVAPTPTRQPPADAEGEAKSEAVAPPSRVAKRRQATRARRSLQLSWKAVVTVVLLGALATAIILVLLQSAGVINWGFLGPVA
jgi:hypothetical protein